MHFIKGRNQIFIYATKKIQIYLYIISMYTEFIKSIIYTFTQKSYFIFNKYLVFIINDFLNCMLFIKVINRQINNEK